MHLLAFPVWMHYRPRANNPALVSFTVGLIIVSGNFPEETEHLAGAVFNTVAQSAMSLGMGGFQVVALGAIGSAPSEVQDMVMKRLASKTRWSC